MPTPSPQFDHQIRVVSLANLRAMCARVSGVMSHWYSVHEPTPKARFVKVYYSNEDEYGRPHPICALFPLIPIYGEIGVVLSIHDVKGDPGYSEAWQYFTPLLDCPVLWCKPDSVTWETADEAQQAQD